MQRNEVEAFLPVGLGTTDLWRNLSLELDGKTTLEKPHVSKKVLIKGIKMQSEALKFLVDEMERMHEKMAILERESKNTQKYVERVNGKLITLQGQHEEVVIQTNELAVTQEEQGIKLQQIDILHEAVEAAKQEVRDMGPRIDAVRDVHDQFVSKVEEDMNAMRQEQASTQEFAMQLEDRMNTEEKELFLHSDKIIHGKLSLAMWMEQADKDKKKQSESLKECIEKMDKQGKNVKSMMLETRRTLDDNTCAVEDVQRELLTKADRLKIEELIESKYEEICNQVDKALSSVLGEEDEFKRVSQELQDLVASLGENKADKKDLLEVKEQVLYDSRVRQQVENLRSFVDLKMNRDDVTAALNSKADKDEMLRLLKELSHGMNASIQRAQQMMAEPENALLTGKNAIAKTGNSNNGHMYGHGHSHNHGHTSSRGGMLPSLDREKCLSCNSTIRNDTASGSGGPVMNKNPFAMTPTYGGGFPRSGITSLDKQTMRNHSQQQISRYSGQREEDGDLRVLVESASDGYLMGVDGHMYQADVKLSALQFNEHTASANSPNARVVLPGHLQRTNHYSVYDEEG